MNDEHAKFMIEAVRLSEESVVSGGGPFGAIIVKEGKIIGRGVNRVTVWNDPTAHAEIVAIREACKYLNSFQLGECVLYTSCEPCPMCIGAIYWARPKIVYFANTQNDAAKIGFDDSFIYEEISKKHSDRLIIFRQIMRDEALDAFKLWSEKSDKIKY